ncbi:MAG: hypothetical protein ACR2LV_03720 [Solirubrobacteraceae bacterium]
MTEAPERRLTLTRLLKVGRVAPLVVALILGGCGASSVGGSSTARPTPHAPASATPHASPSGVLHVRPQAIEPLVGQQAVALPPSAPVGDVNAHAPAIAEVKHELRLELVAARVTSAGYIDPLRYVTVWERTDQGVDAQMPVGAPILAPCRVKVLAVIPGWYSGQPLVYWELLDGPDAGRVQYVAEEITDLAPPGSILAQGQAIARYAASGTGIEYGWSTVDGVTLAVATTGYEEGQVTPAGQSIRAWLNRLGANAGGG